MPALRADADYMAAELDQTCWRGVEIGHPREWELCLASGVDEPGRCRFADRRYERLDVRWRPAAAVPDLDAILTKYRVRLEKKVKLKDLTTCPSGWRGVLRETPDGAVAHAGGFFRERRLLIEATIVWPDRRDVAAERAILRSIGPQTDSESRFWQAMGITLEAPADYVLFEAVTTVGRITWRFRQRGKDRRRGVFTVERIAMPEYWLESSIEKWLTKELPRDYSPTASQRAEYAGHSATVLDSRGKLPGLLPLVKKATEVRRDFAWLCPVEERVYRLAFVETTREPFVQLPEGFAVQCCREEPEACRRPGR
jgi:hypothetical protein